MTTTKAAIICAANAPSPPPSPPPNLCHRRKVYFSKTTNVRYYERVLPRHDDLFYEPKDFVRFWKDAQREEWRDMLTSIPVFGQCFAMGNRQEADSDDEEGEAAMLDSSETTATTVAEEEEWTESSNDESDTELDVVMSIPQHQDSISPNTWIGRSHSFMA